MKSIILSFWSVCSSVILISGAIEYSNRWSVQINGGDAEADRLAHKHGFVNLGKVIDNYYSFQHPEVEKISRLASTHLHKGLNLEPNVKMVEQQEMKSYKLLSSGSVNFYPNDPLFEDMWYINREENVGPTYNVFDVWKRNITGEGVVVAVVDEGFNSSHPEIQGNYDERASWDFIDGDRDPVPKNASVPQYGHGDKCAGVIAAVLNNSECGVGLAYKARLGGIRLFFEEKATDDLECKALSHEPDHIDIYSNSWGPGDKGIEVVGPGQLTQLALKNGTEKGRNGLGSIYVFAAGNGGLIVKDSCAFNGYVNSIYTIAITGINSDGSIPIYGEHCAGIMAVTYSRDIFGDSSKVITADTNSACSEDFGSSSASAAMASGLIALMLSANRNLTWRDVQHIIVRTARPISTVKNAEPNGVGLRVNDYVGFGLMDASKMVDAALNWTTVPQSVQCTIWFNGTNWSIPSSRTQTEPINISDKCDRKIKYLEHVVVRVNLNYTRRGDLLIKLLSPQGTVSNLTHYRHSDSFFKLKELKNWDLMTLHHWGEDATGMWYLILENSRQDHVNTGILFDWALTLHGTTSDPLDDNLHVTQPVFPRSTDKPPTDTEPKRTRLPSDRTVLLTEVFSPESSLPPTGVTTSTKPGLPSDRTVLLTEVFSPESSPPPTRVTTSTKPDVALIVGVVCASVFVVALAVYVGYKKCC